MSFVSNKKNIFLIILFGIIFIINFRYSYITGAQHDYLSNLKMWRSVIDGASPWSLHGVWHGPIFWFTGYFSGLHPLLPKILGFLFWNVIFILICLRANYKLPTIFFFFVIMNSPNFWVEIFKWGHLESIVCFFILISIIYFEKNKFVLSGTFFAIGVCFKLTPIIILPFFCINTKDTKNIFERLNYNFTSSFLAVFILIYLISILIWDSRAVTNFVNMGLVLSENLSFFRYLRGEFSPIPSFSLEVYGQTIPDAISYISYPIMGILYFVLFLKFFLNKIDRVNSILLASLLIPVLYKSSYTQYYTLYFVLVLFYFNYLKSYSLDEFLNKHFVVLLPLVIVTLHNFIHSYATHIYFGQEDPFWGGGSYGYFKLNEWIGLLALIFFIPALNHFYKNKYC